MNLPFESMEDSPLSLPSLQCTDFEPELIFHPGRQASQADHPGVVSPLKRPRSQFHSSIQRRDDSTKQKRKKHVGSSFSLPPVDSDSLENHSNGVLGMEDNEDAGETHPDDMHNDGGEEFVKYTEAVQYECVGFIQLHHGLFAVEGWGKEQGQGNVGSPRSRESS
ncbi:hypothetical protein GYMLUDRAFT_252280 [Collybiopsis luxurians FD-317 M1]|uniref:Uncharacterized protein n=1 Tax=Collybiopsis luxurians FD-317 M1 TaxID=944289 RepID=A0A0D0C0N7_9AGAR|nr:hypothetical protein GYMLUDRAFT_252280 [Collybiopsis luxurians FD-317 M1]